MNIATKSQLLVNFQTIGHKIGQNSAGVSFTKLDPALQSEFGLVGKNLDNILGLSTAQELLRRGASTEKLIELSKASKESGIEDAKALLQMKNDFPNEDITGDGASGFLKAVWSAQDKIRDGFRELILLGYQHPQGSKLVYRFNDIYSSLKASIEKNVLRYFSGHAVAAELGIVDR